MSRKWAMLPMVATIVTMAGCGTALAPASAVPSAASLPTRPTPSGSAPPASTPNPANDIPVLDGEPWISFQWGSESEDGEAIFLIRPDGSDKQELVPDLEGSDFHPDWSPDGSRIAFIHYGPGERSELWVAGADGSDATQLVSCESPCNSFSYPDWSPDGKAIYYGWDSHATGGPPTTFGVGRYDFATGVATDVLSRTDGMTAEQPRVSPDGTRIAYDRGSIDGTGPGIALFVADLAGGPEHQVTDWTTMAAHPDWAGNDHLIFNSYDLGFFQDTDEASNLYRVAADGSDLRQLTSFGRSDTRVTQPRMTPDGSGIVFTRVEGDGYGTRTLAIVNVDGTALRGLTPTEVDGTHPQLRPTVP